MTLVKINNNLRLRCHYANKLKPQVTSYIILISRVDMVTIDEDHLILFFHIRYLFYISIHACFMFKVC